MTARRALVIGFGSIGQRHARILEELGCEVAVVSRRDVAHARPFGSLEEGLSKFGPDYVVIASRTSEHADDLMRLAAQQFSGSVLIEKPLFETRIALPKHDFPLARIAYNLRFHPVIKALANQVKAEKILSVHGFAGQYLPSWRPGTDYRQSYSARQDQGGGVLLDLSHDIDLMCLIAGRWKSLTALGGKMSSLEIDSEDMFSLLISFEREVTGSLTLNYLDRKPRREIIVQCENATFTADLIAGTLMKDASLIGTYETVRDLTYIGMHKAMLFDNGAGLCSLDEALAVLDMVSAAKNAAQHQKWIQNV